MMVEKWQLVRGVLFIEAFVCAVRQTQFCSRLHGKNYPETLVSPEQPWVSIVLG